MKHTLYLRDNTLYLNYTQNNKRTRVSLNKLVKILSLEKTNALEYLESLSLNQILKMLNNLKKGACNVANTKEPKIKKPKSTKEITILEAKESFLNQKIGLKNTSLNAMRLSFNTIFRFLEVKENSKLSKITKQSVENYHKQAFKTLKKNTLASYNALLKSFLEFCENESYIEKSPYFKITLKNAAEGQKIQPFSLDEIKALVEIAPSLRLKAFLMTAFLTGLRTGEQLALLWSDIDFERKKINIDKSLNPLGEITSPKNKSSIREVDLLEPVEIVLKELKESEPKNKKMVFLSIPKRTNEFQDAFKKLLKILGLKERKLYTTRHTFASLMLSKGEEPMWVSKNMGHKDLNITYSTYSHFIPQQERARASFLKGVL
ncbi:tyrosine-type recombinase/integrase [Helicobacter cetorum]|uniref:tyrosine-type recombinase/integrase n=1 Tax=Helicobacter cetorum TaxID=138563 RepID=UPI000CF06B58|nr:tyrosine-type recombinase/integrase [Helicobacter cetorum]